MSDTNWTTVVNKKKGPVTKADVKRAQQNFAQGDNVPKVLPNAPLKIDSTPVAKAFEDKNQNEAVEDLDGYPSMVPLVESKSPRLKRDKKKSKPPSPTFDVKGAFQKLDYIELSNLLNNIQTKFPSSPLIWVKEMASWIQNILQSPYEKDIGYTQKNEDYPACYLPTKVRVTIVDLINKCPANILGDFFLFLTASLVSQIQHGKGTLCERSLIQLLNSARPEILSKHCAEVVRGKSTSSEDYLAVIWAFSQYRKNISDCFHVWWTSMFPCLKLKHHANASIKYLQKIIRIHRNSLSDGPSCISEEQLLQLLQARSSLAHSPNLCEDFEELLPHLMQMHLRRENSIRTFSFFLPLLNKADVEAGLKSQILSILVECLLTSKSVMEHWSSSVTTSLKASAQLLRHIEANADEFSLQAKESGEYPRNAVGKSAYLILTNLKSANKLGKMEKKAGFKDCRNTCLAMLRHQEKSNRRFFTFGRIIIFILIALTTLVTLDIRKNTWNGSKTAEIVKKYGLDEKAEVAFKHTQHYTNILTSACQKHVLPVYMKVHAHVAPAMEASWKHIGVAAKWTHIQLKPALNYMNKVVPPVLEKITDHIHAAYVILSTYTIQICSNVYPIVQEYTNCTINWLSVNIPLAYQYVRDLILTILNNIYQLSPQNFDQIQLSLKELCHYIVVTAPVAWQHVSDAAVSAGQMTHAHIVEGKSWLTQKMMGST